MTDDKRFDEFLFFGRNFFSYFSPVKNTLKITQGEKKKKKKYTSKIIFLSCFSRNKFAFFEPESFPIQKVFHLSSSIICMEKLFCMLCNNFKRSFSFYMTCCKTNFWHFICFQFKFMRILISRWSFSSSRSCRMFNQCFNKFVISQSFLITEAFSNSSSIELPVPYNWMHSIINSLPLYFHHKTKKFAYKSLN